MLDFVIDGAIEQKTGGYLYDRLVIEGLRARGLRVEVVSLDPRRPALARESLRVARLLDRAAREDRTVVVDELCHPRAAFAAARHLARSGGRPCSHLVTLVHHLAASERSGARRAIRLAVERALLRASGRVIATSETTRDALARVGVAPERIAVVRPGRDRLGTRAAPPRRAAGAGVRLLFVGALTARKDPLTLVRAFAVAALPGARLTLAGPADRDACYAARVLAAAASLGRAARVTGEIDDEALAAELAHADVLVLPSRYEGYGIVLAEALSHGLAVIACRAGAVPEVVRSGREALLVEPGDAVALAAAMREVGRPGRLEAMQAAAIERAAELPTWADAQREMAALLVG